jgi:hypothetical protein
VTVFEFPRNGYRIKWLRSGLARACELLHDQRGGIRTLRVGENHNGVLGAHPAGG